MEKSLTALSAVLVFAGLAGCSASASASLTVSADQLARTAEDALESEVGARPEIDCGDEQIRLKNGEEADCILTDPTTGTQFDADVTISEVEGTDYVVNVQVAETPRQ